MRLRTTPLGTIVEEPPAGRWVSLEGALRHAGIDDEALSAAAADALAFLRGGSEVREATAALLEVVRGVPEVEADPAAAVVPFAIRSLRAFSVWESHMIGSARAIARRFMPPPVRLVTGTFERVTGRTFPAFKPKDMHYETPALYMANHTAIVGDSRLAERERKLVWGPSRHGPGNNDFIYFKDTEQAFIECFSELAQIDDGHEPRRWPISADTLNRWSRRPPLEFLLAGAAVAPPDRGRPAWTLTPPHTPNSQRRADAPQP